MELVIAINAGSTTAATMNEVRYQADQYFTGGEVNGTTDAIIGVVEDEVYQSERYGAVTYNVPVTNSRYSVVLHFVEMFHSTAGARAFNVTVEGETVLNALDIYSLSGHDGAFEYIVEDVDVSDGTLTIALTMLTENPTISGFAIYSDAGGRLAP